MASFVADRSPTDGTAGAVDAPRTTHLHLVSTTVARPPPSAEDRLRAFVRSVRRDMARLLRALQATGRPVGTLPDGVVTRLAHLDAVTARFLARPDDADRAEVEDAALGIRALERWVVGTLSASERAQVRLCALRTRIDDDDVRGPLVHVDLPPSPIPGPGTRTLHAGLSACDEPARRAIAYRLGLSGPRRSADGAESFEAAVARRLVDGHLLGVLVATLSPAALRLLGRIVAAGTLRLPPDDPHHAAADELVPTALVFERREADGRRELWTPVDLHRRIDGLLRAMVPA